MRKMNLRSQFYLALVAILVTMNACNSNDPSPTGTINLEVAGSGSTTFSTSGRSGGRLNAAIEITDFQIGIRDVVFKTDTGDSTDVAFRGPYVLDLLTGNDALTQSIGTVEIPNGTYQELRFKFHKDRDLDMNHPLYDRSIFIKGTIDGVPFEMWHDTSENLDIGKATGGVTVNENVVDLVINFTIDQFLSSRHAIDLSLAEDGNQDGLIEINPNDDDGNRGLADDLKENIKEAADLLDGK